MSTYEYENIHDFDVVRLCLFYPLWKLYMICLCMPYTYIYTSYLLSFFFQWNRTKQTNNERICVWYRIVPNIGVIVTNIVIVTWNEYYCNVFCFFFTLQSLDSMEEMFGWFNTFFLYVKGKILQTLESTGFLWLFSHWYITIVINCSLIYHPNTV